MATVGGGVDGLGSPLDGSLEVLSVAPHFGSGRIPFAGHEETYQLGMSRAAAGAGVPWTILAAADASFTEGPVLPCLDRSSPEATARSLDRFLRERTAMPGRMTGIVVYEGSTALARALSAVAACHPQVRWLINLFRAEPGLDVPLVRRKRHATQDELIDSAADALAQRLGPLAAADWPDNLRLTAETDAKALLARSVGLPVTGVWRLHSAMADQPRRSGATGHRHQGWQETLPIRILIALRSSQLHPPLVEDVLDVIRRVARVDAGRSVAWIMAGRFDDHPRVNSALRCLQRSGVEIRSDDRPLEPDAYARTFLDVDAVWMPAVWPYRVQSSGKALDALVLGRPIIAPAGTTPANAMQRWVPGAPAYGSTTEAAQTFLRLPTLVGHLQAELARQAAVIRTAHHPKATVAWICSELLQPPVSPGAISNQATRWPALDALGGGGATVVARTPRLRPCEARQSSPQPLLRCSSERSGGLPARAGREPLAPPGLGGRRATRALAAIRR